MTMFFIVSDVMGYKNWVIMTIFLCNF